MNHMIGEYDFSDANRDKERERRFRLQALEPLPGDEVRLEHLRVDAERAAALLRWALGEAAVDARALALAVRAVIVARGNLNGLGLIETSKIGTLVLADHSQFSILNSPFSTPGRKMLTKRAAHCKRIEN